MQTALQCDIVLSGGIVRLDRTPYIACEVSNNADRHKGARIRATARIESASTAHAVLRRANDCEEESPGRDDLRYETASRIAGERGAEHGSDAAEDCRYHLVLLLELVLRVGLVVRSGRLLRDGGGLLGLGRNECRHDHQREKQESEDSDPDSTHGAYSFVWEGKRYLERELLTQFYQTPLWMSIKES